MKTFSKFCAQGDIYIQKLEALPDDISAYEDVKPEGENIIITHSETGHHHVMDAGAATMKRLPDSIMDCLLVVEKPTELRHLRSFDQHEDIRFEPGVYHVRRQREYTPEGYRRVED